MEMFNPITPLPIHFKIVKVLLTGLLSGSLVIAALPALPLITLVLGVTTFFAAISKMRFSLRTMAAVMLWGGASATLLTKLQQPGLFSIGIVSTLLLIAFIISSIARANIPAEQLNG